MTSRIKELAREATTWCEQYAKGTPTAWEWEEKFAQLIINDCVGVLADAEAEFKSVSENSKSGFVRDLFCDAEVTTHALIKRIREHYDD